MSVHLVSLSTLLWPHSVFLALLVTALAVPPSSGRAYGLALVATAIAAIACGVAHAQRKAELQTAARDIAGVLTGLLLAWHIATAHLHLLNPILLPPPEAVFQIIATDALELMYGMGRSVVLLVLGYLLALLVAIPLGIVTGWYLRLYAAAVPIIKVLGPLPPVMYVPYAIALLPTFRFAAVWVVFIGAFWPLLARTIHGVRTIPATQLDAARTLNLPPLTLLWKIVFPATLPAVCGGASVALVFAFVMLTSAELIGASGGIASGLGYYVMYADQIQDHRRVLGGIFVIGLLVVAIVKLFDQIEKRLLHWRD